MLGMTSRYFDGLLMCAVTALSLYKPNMAWARPQVSEMGAKFSSVWGTEPPFQHPLLFSWDCLHKPLSPSSSFYRGDGRRQAWRRQRSPDLRGVAATLRGCLPGEGARRGGLGVRWC